MPYSADTIPGNFPLGYVLASSPGADGHQLYVKERWRGVCPGADYTSCGGRNADGSVGDYWQIGCTLACCDEWEGSVLTTSELLRELVDGRVVGVYHDGFVAII